MLADSFPFRVWMRLCPKYQIEWLKNVFANKVNPLTILRSLRYKLIDWNKIDCWTSWQVHAELHKWGFVRKWLSFLKLKRSFFDVLKYNMQDETNHLFPQVNGTRIMSTSQTIQTWTAIFGDFLFFFKFEQSRGEEEIFFFYFILF